MTMNTFGNLIQEKLGDTLRLGSVRHVHGLHCIQCRKCSQRYSCCSPCGPSSGTMTQGTYPRSAQDVNKPYSPRSKKYGESQEKKPTLRMCGEAGLRKILPARYIKPKTGYFVFINVSTKQSPLLSGINSQLSLYNYCFVFFGTKSYRRELIQILVLLRQMHVVVAPK